jgi:hypothetical protein
MATDQHTHWATAATMADETATEADTQWTTAADEIATDQHALSVAVEHTHWATAAETATVRMVETRSLAPSLPSSYSALTTCLQRRSCRDLGETGPAFRSFLKESLIHSLSLHQTIETSGLQDPNAACRNAVPRHVLFPFASRCPV